LQGRNQQAKIVRLSLGYSRKIIYKYTYASGNGVNVSEDGREQDSINRALQCSSPAVSQIVSVNSVKQDGSIDRCQRRLSTVDGGDSRDYVELTPVTSKRLADTRSPNVARSQQLNGIRVRPSMAHGAGMSTTHNAAG